MNNPLPLKFHFTRTIRKENFTTLVLFKLLDLQHTLLGKIMVHEDEAIFRCVDVQHSFVIKKKRWEHQWFHQHNQAFFAGYRSAKVGINFADGTFYSINVSPSVYGKYEPPLAAIVYDSSGKEVLEINIDATEKTAAGVINGTINTRIEEVQKIAGLLLFIQKRFEDAERQSD